MEKETVTILVTIAKDHRDLLRKMAAEKNLMDPDQVSTAAGLAREIITYHLEKGLPVRFDLNVGERGL
jgi:hypothetical protein